MAKSNVSSWAGQAMALVRIGLGYIFLWAFLDKLIGLGFATCKDKLSGVVDVGCSSAWLQGGSPTEGFLGNAVSGPLADFYHGLAGQAWVDWLFMLGLAFVGLGLLFGTWIRAAALAGIAMMLLMWSSLLWPANSPGVDEHIIYALIFLAFAVSPGSAARWSLSSWWQKTMLAKKLKFLR